MHFISYFFTADNAAIGRFDPSMLSDYVLMDLLYVPDDYEQSRAEMKGEEDDACTWRMISCDAQKNVKEIQWHGPNIKLCGSISFPALPPKLSRFSIINQPARGEIDTTNLPRSLEFLCVQWTQVTGTVDPGNLPKSIETIYIIENNITAIVNIVNLPASLEDIAVNEKNIQDKSIYVGKLPESQPYLDFADCGFTAILCADPADRCRIRTEADLSSTFSDMSYTLESDTSEEESE